MNVRSWPCWAKVAIAVAVTVFVFNWPSTSGEWAAWVQAVGVLLAIAVTAYLSRADSQAREMNAKLNRQARVDILVGLAIQLSDYSSKLLEECRKAVNMRVSDYFTYGAPVSEVEQLASMIREASLNACINPEMVELALGIRQCAQRLVADMKDAQTQYQKDVCVPYEDQIEDTHDRIKSLVNEFLAASKRL